MTTEDPVIRLSEEECWQRLRGSELGRLVTRVGEVIDIFPINFVTDGTSIVFRTAEGSKLIELTVNHEVLFEVDEHTDADAWSVIVRGSAHTLDTLDEREAADRLGLKPWVPTLKYNYVRIRPSSVSGRAFQRTGEPERYGVSDY
ncbi:pyridoxamine 5'-phosphate oxidase family protein [Microbacterium sp.]|uniref:pyridoxamine 5'-phosphate oxidase family protein n=1 Tax=Microbacterium sp. TaxID=51671 RepID=UPI0028A5D089|nr:pyridoxamine 5'-phosphate oxidase family protein [Microbacterium sp.]